MNSDQRPDREVVAYRIWPLAEGLLAGLGVYFTFLFVSFFIYHHAINAQKGEIRDGLLHTASVVSTLIDGDAHRQFTHPGQENTDAYIQFIEPLTRVLQKDETIAYIYTCILRENKVYFVIDPTPEGDHDGDGVDDKSHIMEEYEDATPLMFYALANERPVADAEPHRDRWGTFISAFVPFYDSDSNFVGIVGVDLSVDRYFQRLAPIKRATVRAFASAFFISWIIGAIVWFIRNFAKIINEDRIKLLS